ncbi:hypothetical protein NL676_015567 [Syzygium grande]|nr:hypothetical protein NL676_015567 [Syzygium grande]
MQIAEPLQPGPHRTSRLPANGIPPRHGKPPTSKTAPPRSPAPTRATIARTRAHETGRFPPLKRVGDRAATTAEMHLTAPHTRGGPRRGRDHTGSRSSGTIAPPGEEGRGGVALNSPTLTCRPTHQLGRQIGAQHSARSQPRPHSSSNTSHSLVEKPKPEPKPMPKPLPPAAAMSSPSPSPSPSWPPSPPPAATAAAPAPRTVPLQQQYSPPSKSAVNFSPPLIAMVAVVAAAFLIVSYSRLISRHLLRLHRRLSSRRRRRRRYHPSASSFDLNSPPPFFDSPDAGGAAAFHLCSPYGLDDAVIKTIPLSLYTAKGHDHRARDCAVCLLEFEESDYVRTLPGCGHAFHVDCIDMWLRSHANCPLCRAGICLLPQSPFVPLMAARIRPSLDEDAILRDIILEEPLAETEDCLDNPNSPHSNRMNGTTVTEIVEEQSPRRTNPLSEDRTSNARDFLLKRSYSFGFERSLASERLVLEPVTASPWSKRLSPFGSLPKPRVFSFRYYRGMKSPFFKRRGGGGGGGGGGFFPLSESSVRFSSGASGGGGSSRRSKSIASPMFARPSGAYSSSRLRCGDPEALLSPERFNRGVGNRNRKSKLRSSIAVCEVTTRYMHVPFFGGGGWETEIAGGGNEQASPTKCMWTPVVKQGITGQ